MTSPRPVPISLSKAGKPLSPRFAAARLLDDAAAARGFGVLLRSTAPRWPATWSAPASRGSNGRAMRRPPSSGRARRRQARRRSTPLRTRPAGDRCGPADAKVAGPALVAALRAGHFGCARRGARRRHRRMEPRHAPAPELRLRGRNAGAPAWTRRGGTIGVLLVTGGSQTRIGSHRMYERLAKSLAGKGYPCFRYDRRGVGDSGGKDPGFRGSGPDIAAAAAAFRGECPCAQRVDRLRPLRRRDGDRLVRRAGRAGRPDPRQSLAGRGRDAGTPPPAAIRRHYRAAPDEPRRLEENARWVSGLAQASQRRRRTSAASCARRLARRRRCAAALRACRAARSS